jgi:flagellar hook-associated protein 1
MSLTSALHTAQSALINTARQTQVVSGNISNAHDPNYTRKQAATVSMAPGVRTVTITRMADEALFRQNLSALSGYEAQNRLMEGLDRLALAVNGADNKTAVATTIGKFQEALQLFSATPSSSSSTRSATWSALTGAPADNASTAADAATVANNLPMISSPI